MDFKNKFVIVTGASTGIGRAIAMEFGKKGAIVGIVARRKNELDETKKLVEKSGGIAEQFISDLSDPDVIKNLIKDIAAKTKIIDAVCNVAGIWHGKDSVYSGIDYDNFESGVIINTINVGLIAPMLLVKDLVSRMPKGSAILNLSGTFIYGGKGQVPYFVSKRAIEDFTVALSDDLKSRGINVNCISPSDTSTDALKKYYPEDAIDANTPEQVAKLAVSICQKNVTGKFWKIKHAKVTTDGYHK